MLTNVYRWFIEGFETPDLKDGKPFEWFGVDLAANSLPHLRAKGPDAFAKSPVGFSAWPIDHSMSVARVAG